MKRLGKLTTNFINILIAVSLATIVVLVLGNTLLRYVFNSGITWSEEASRYLFIWVVFLGAIIALKDKKHISLELPYHKLPLLFQKLLFVVSRLLILTLVILVFWGGYHLTKLNWVSTSPAIGLPLGLVYSSLLVVSVGMAIVVLIELYKAFFRTDYVENEFKPKDYSEGSEDE